MEPRSPLGPAAESDLRLQRRVGELDHLEHDRPVTDRQHVTDVEIGEQALVIDPQVIGGARAGALTGLENDLLADLEHDRMIECPDPDLGARQVGHHPDRAADGLGDAADLVQPLDRFVEGPV